MYCYYNMTKVIYHKVIIVILEILTLSPNTD